MANNYREGRYCRGGHDHAHDPAQAGADEERQQDGRGMQLDRPMERACDWRASRTDGRVIAQARGVRAASVS